MGDAIRDSQRGRVFKSYHTLQPFTKPFPKPQDCDRFIQRLWTSKRLRAAYPGAFKYWADIPSFRSSSKDTKSLVYKLAIALSSRQFGSATIARHGREFCEVWLKVVLYGMGREAHDTLKAAFKANKVKYRPKRTRPPDPNYTEFQKDIRMTVLRDRLAKARAARAEKRQGEIAA